MSAPAVTITIDRTSLALSPLEFSGSADGDYGIVTYSPPALISQVAYMPDSQDIHGSEALSSRYLQGVLGFSWFRVNAADEATVQTAYAAVAAAIGQFSFGVTTQVSGAPAQTWAADSGSIQLGSTNGRTYVDLATRTPVYSVSIPVYPIPEA